ncbi:MAG: PEP-CTERM sorting domain-containing protein [Caldimonas sp.]
MQFAKSLLAAAALMAAFSANAVVTGQLRGGPASTFAILSTTSVGTVCGGGATCALSGAITATIVGGTVYANDQAFADQPAGTVAGDLFLSAGPAPSNNSPATMHFDGTGLDYISFLWGSPDLYNTLTVKSTGNPDMDFTVGPGSLNFAVTNGNQSFSQYVEFFGNGAKITDLIFKSPAQNAFEATNFTVTAVPEPETYALMLAGLGAIGFMSRRRRKA